jgi:hypothetical protein
MRVNASGDDDTARDTPQNAPRLGRRLSDKILVAFHHACDVSDLEIADALLRALETIVTRKPSPHQSGRRRDMESLVAAHERLWQLRNPDADD